MFELRRQGAVAGHRRPAVLEHLHVGSADVDHRLDREEHTGAKLWTGAGAAGVDDFGAVVEQPAEAVAAEIADDAIAMLFGVRLDCVADVAEAIDRAMRTSEGTTIWYLRVIHHLAQNGEVWTYDIAGEEWGEVDFPEDLTSAEALCAAWDSAIEGDEREAAAA